MPRLVDELPAIAASLPDRPTRGRHARMELASVLIGSDDLARARRDYALLLGVEAGTLADGSLRFRLGRGAVELARATPGLRAIRFSGTTAAALAEISFHGISVVAASEEETSDRPAGDDAPTNAPIAIDHVVIQTADGDRAIALWRDRIGLRLALDRTFPERGLRLIFFRSGGMTLEFATPVAGSGAAVAGGSSASHDDVLYGVSYRVADLSAHRARLLGHGVDVSEIRRGMKPGTVVATVRSGSGGVPTLLLQVASSTHASAG